ncbi:hypothetical protein AcV5_007689 [Taiwanofungus camphoratus]|nr:hypothetical protein AcV5_007689 [Antrodia cinnamomea]
MYKYCYWAAWLKHKSATSSTRSTTFNMSLPTPPSTSHRDKENRFSAGTHVVWSEEHVYHQVPASPPCLSIEASASKGAPTKSILKKTSYPLLPLVDENQKETTPEPSDPLADLRYLEGPVSRIIAVNATLSDCIEAYSILAARLRACITGRTVADASWPLFQPFRQHRDAVVDALVRDLGRALVDPNTSASGAVEPAEEPEGERTMALPSPRQSPRKKKGMSGEQVKYARDLCTTSHAVMKLLNVVFTLPAVYRVFSNEQLGFILTHVLAIPLANELPTPNARKTYALSIWLLQTQRLPVDVLAPAKDRITYAIRRAIEGELGKEGKKGSAADGFKAIHDLSTQHPAVFVPAFTELLPSMLSNLLAPTLGLRTQACHALSGFALALAKLPLSSLHTSISNTVASHLSRSPETPSNQPCSPSKDPLIIRTLRTTLSATDPKHAAQGPVWAWSVLANFVVLLGPAIFMRDKLTRSLTALFSLGMRHPKSSVRALGCVVWRCIIWAYFHPPLMDLRITAKDDDSFAEEDGRDEASEEDPEEAQKKYTRRYNRRLDSVWKIVQSVVDIGAGSALIGALLSRESTDESNLKRALALLRAMSKKGGQTCKEAVQVACQLMTSWSCYQRRWQLLHLLPRPLFCANPDLLTADFKLLPQTIKPLLTECADISNIRMLTKDEVTLEWVFDSLLDVLKEGLSSLQLSWGCEIPLEILDLWFRLLKGNAIVFEGDENRTMHLADRAISILIDILDDDTLELSTQADDAVSTEIIGSPVKPFKRRAAPPLSADRLNLGLKLFLVCEFWNLAKAVFPANVLSRPAEQLLLYLDRNDATLVEDMDFADEIRAQWSYLCAEVAFVCDVSELDKFWRGRLCPQSRRRERSWSDAVRSAVWHKFVEKWRKLEGGWEAAVVLLGVPFVDVNAWDMTNNDLEDWDAFLRIAMDKALDHGIDSVSVIDHVASAISLNDTPTLSSSTRIADLLLSHLEICEARQIPSDVLEFVNNTLVSTYPPEPRNKVTSMWLMRSLTRIIDACPQELYLNLFDLIQEGLRIWIADEYEVFTAEEYSMDILPVYQTVLLGIQSLPCSVPTLEAVCPLVESAFCGRQDKPIAALQAFEDFWQASYADMPEPCWGWPERIMNCLQAFTCQKSREAKMTDVVSEDKAGREADNTATIESCDSPEVKTEMAPYYPEQEESEEEEVIRELQPVLLHPVLASPSQSSISIPEMPQPPMTPQSSPTGRLMSTPARPHKVSSRALFTSLLESPSSPITTPPPRGLITPKRSPPSTSSHALSSSARRRGIGNKENVSPLPTFASVTERIEMKSLGPPLSVLGKRRSMEEIDEKLSKKNKTDLSPSFSALTDDMANLPSDTSEGEVEQSVRVSVFFQGAPRLEKGKSPSNKGIPSSIRHSDDPFLSTPGASSSKTATSSVPVSRPNKRKAEFLDAVEVPTFREVLRLERQARLRSSSTRHPKSPSSGQCTPKGDQTKTPFRRTRSASRLLGNLPFERLEDTPTKRRKSRVSELEEDASSPSLSSPLRALQEARVAGSDDSIMLASPSKHTPSQPSSDDDPHIGQVTPLGVVSPGLRRVKRTDFDPPSSDDSGVSASPTRQHVERRIARLPSSRTCMTPSPLNFRSRSLSDFTSHGSDA